MATPYHAVAFGTRRPCHAGPCARRRPPPVAIEIARACFDDGNGCAAAATVAKLDHPVTPTTVDFHVA